MNCKNQTIKSLQSMLVVGLALFSVQCGTAHNLSPDDVTDLTYPSSFKYVHRKQIVSKMHHLARTLDSLEKHFQDNPSEPSMTLVLQYLMDLQTTANKLAGGTTNNEKIDRYLPQFWSDIEAAKQQVQSTPPDFSKAQQVGYACHNCHMR
ncbi:MAG: hypothetical protein KDK51_08900, partial [Deltaproteobacteria bacterium]|nr:hypothetical protein [Deltaproteobacteria bacterium]